MRAPATPPSPEDVERLRRRLKLQARLAQVVLNLGVVGAFIAYYVSGAPWDAFLGRFIVGAVLGAVAVGLYGGWRHFADQDPDR